MRKETSNNINTIVTCMREIEKKDNIYLLPANASFVRKTERNYLIFLYNMILSLHMLK